MSWFLVDDNIADHPAVLKLQKRSRAHAIGVWTLCGGWLSRHLNPDLFVPMHVVREKGGSDKIVDELVHAGFWVAVDNPVDNGVEFTDICCRISNPDKLDAKRRATAARVDKHRRSKRMPPDQELPENVTPLHRIDQVSVFVPSFTPLTPPPAATCPRHPHGTHRGCRGCDQAAAALDDWEHQRMVCCILCDEKGWAYGPDGSVHPGGPKCTHPFGPGDVK